MSQDARLPHESRLRRLREASEWLLRMQDTARTDADIDEWLRWCAADPQNISEFEKLHGDWHDLDSLKAVARARPVSRRRASEGAASVRVRDTSRRGQGEDETPVWGFVRWRAAAASTVLALAVGIGVLGLWVRHRGGTRSAPQEIAATDMNRAATLPDGSRVILRPDSAVDVDYGRRERTLVLLAGEAYFKVRHDQHHPFIVRAGDVRIADVGTSFDVRRGRARTTVTVEAGMVDITRDRWSQEGLPGVWRVQAGYQFSYSNERRAEVISRVDVARTLHWRDEELAYVREPLGSVIDDLNRYSAHKIIVGEQAIGRLPFTGTAFPSALSDWLKAIQQAYPVAVRTAPNGDIVLTLRQGESGTSMMP